MCCTIKYVSRGSAILFGSAKRCAPAGTRASAVSSTAAMYVARSIAGANPGATGEFPPRPATLYRVGEGRRAHRRRGHAPGVTVMEPASTRAAPSSRRLEPLKHVAAGVLDVAYYEAG